VAILKERQAPSEVKLAETVDRSADAIPSDSRPAAFPSSEEFFANPLAAIRRVHEDMDRIFAQAWSRGADTPNGMGGNGNDLTVWTPVIETKQQDGNLVISAELPGLKPEEVEVEVQNGALVIQGERRREINVAGGGIQHTERSYGRFYRSIPLPEEANGDLAAASFHDGVLEVTIPLSAERSRRRQIPITRVSSLDDLNRDAPSTDAIDPSV
jgi:HSP20 family protein